MGPDRQVQPEFALLTFYRLNSKGDRPMPKALEEFSGKMGIDKSAVMIQLQKALGP